MRVARAYTLVLLSEAARARVIAARKVVDHVAQSGAAVYGLTTALGANTGLTIPPDEQSRYQTRAVQARAVGIGPRHATDVVRAMLFARAAGMAVGGSGVSPAVLDALIEMLNARVHPSVPSLGSIGTADLAPLSHLALPLLGAGFAEYEGALLPGAEALARARLKPVPLSGKDGIALISANAATIGHAALVLHDVAAALDALNVAVALSFEGFRANLSPLDPRVQAARPAPGQCEIAARLTGLLTGSVLWQPQAARRVQDPISLRCVTQVHGTALASLLSARSLVELELNSAAESPLVLPDSNEMLSNGNFHVPGLAIAFDALGLALAQTAFLCVVRCQKLCSPTFSGLPLQLTTRGPEHSGFATVQKTLTALYNEIRHLANPASLDSVPVSEGIEDHASMAANVVAKTAAIAPSLRFLAAIELLAAAQAVDLRGLAPDAMGQGPSSAYSVVRQHAATLDEDRPLGPDIEAVEAAIRSGRLVTVDLLAR